MLPVWQPYLVSQPIDIHANEERATMLSIIALLLIHFHHLFHPQLLFHLSLARTTAVATSLLTLLWADASSSTAYPSLYVSGVIGTLVAPYAAWQQHKMTETNALVETNTHMSEQVQQLQEENVQLQRQVQELEENVRR